jgi:FAD/FMN-containing dehydrogenase
VGKAKRGVRAQAVRGGGLGAAAPGVRVGLGLHLLLHQAQDVDPVGVVLHEGADGQAFLRDFEDKVNTLVFDQVLKFKGSISAEHGVGELKVGKLPLYKDPAALAMMRAVKQALDPQNILNPGRVLT